MQNIDLSDFILLPPGKTAICRRPLDKIPNGARLATAAELLVANLGYPFPWGDSADPRKSKTAMPWWKHSMGMGGLIFGKWFGTHDGRFGGAENVPDEGEHALRYCMLLDGGMCDGKDNEGFAVVVETDAASADMYRQVQLYAARHVDADSGRIILSPIGDDGIIHVGFGGRCFQCPSPALISFPGLQGKFPQYHFELWPEWMGWSLIA